MSKSLSLKTERVRVLVSADLDQVIGGLGGPVSSAKPDFEPVSSAKPNFGPVSSAKPQHHHRKHEPVSSVRPSFGPVSSVRPR